MATHRYSLPKVFYYYPLAGLLLSIAGLFFSYYAFVSLALFAYLSFRNSVNVLQVIGPIYWIWKDTVPANTPMFAKGFMHETSAPWRIGKGLQIRLVSHSIQIGICHKQDYDETEGTLSSIQGRFLDIEPIEIREW